MKNDKMLHCNYGNELEIEVALSNYNWGCEAGEGFGYEFPLSLYSNNPRC